MTDEIPTDFIFSKFTGCVCSTDDDGVVVAVFYSRTGEVCVVVNEREDPHLSAFVSAKWTNVSFTFFPPGKLWFPDKNILAI